MKPLTHTCMWVVVTVLLILFVDPAVGMAVKGTCDNPQKWNECAKHCPSEQACKQCCSTWGEEKQFEKCMNRCKVVWTPFCPQCPPTSQPTSQPASQPAKAD